MAARNRCHRASADSTRRAASASEPPTALRARSSANAVNTSFPLPSRNLTKSVACPLLPLSSKSSKPRHSGHDALGGSAAASAEKSNTRARLGHSTPTRSRCPLSGVAKRVRRPPPVPGGLAEASSPSISSQSSSIVFIPSVVQFKPVKLLLNPNLIDLILHPPRPVRSGEAQRECRDEANTAQSRHLLGVCIQQVDQQ